MIFEFLRAWRRNAAARRSIAALEARADALERTHGYGIKRSDQLSRSPVEHVRDAPLEPGELWVKQINAAMLTDLGRAALAAAFPGFADQPADEKQRRDYAALMSTRWGHFEVNQAPQRRYAGDDGFPRGRYHAVCDERGDDHGTLVGELRAYYEPERVGVVQLFDCTLPDDLQKVRQLGIPAREPKQLVFVFPPLNGTANPFIKVFSDLIGQARLRQLESLAVSVGLPLTVQRIRRKRVLDLREPDTGAWVARSLSSLQWRPDDVSMPCFPRRRPLAQLSDLLPELLAQENGGGGACVALGVLLRYLGADGLIFPSARNDTAVVVDGSTVGVSDHGWNFVDYADTSPPEFVAWIEQGNQWPSRVGFRPYSNAAADKAPLWYPDVTVSSQAGGGWQVVGLRRRTNLAWRKKLLRYAMTCSRGELSELARGTLSVLPDTAAQHGQIDFAGQVAKLVFEAMLGLDEAADGLAALREQLASLEDYRQSFDEVLEKVYRSAREKRGATTHIYIPWQGQD